MLGSYTALTTTVLYVLDVTYAFSSGLLTQRMLSSPSSLTLERDWSVVVRPTPYLVR